MSHTSSILCTQNSLGALYAARIAHCVAAAAVPAHLLLALTAGLQHKTDHAAAATALAVPVALLQELPAYIRCTEQLCAAFAVHHAPSPVQLSGGGEGLHKNLLLCKTSIMFCTCHIHRTMLL